MIKKLVLVLLLMGSSLIATDLRRPVFNPFQTIDWKFFADNFEWKNKLCSCSVGDTGLVKAGFEVSFYEIIAVAGVSKTPMSFPSIGFTLDDGLGRKEGTTREAGNSTSAFRYTDMLIYPLFSIINMVTDYLCFERMSVLNFGYISEVNPAHNNDTIAGFLNPHKLLFALASPSCIMDCAASTFNEPINSMYICAGCWEPIGLNTGWTTGSQPLTEAGTLVSRMLDDMHKTYSMTKTSNAGFASSTTNAKPLNSMCNETYFPMILKTQYNLQQAYPVVWDAVRIGQNRVPWADFKMGKDRGEDIAFWIWRKRDQCAGAYNCQSTFSGLK